MLEMKNLDYYEFLQISPNADSDTIHRVYRFLAARFHPDNPASGDPEKFFMLKTAYDVLSNSESRSKYDDARQREAADQTPLSTSVDFMDQFEGELNRRLAILAVLYYRRRNCSESPSVSLPEIEKQMGFPRDYLDFTTWYLLKKGYITRADNSDFTLTADGVDFVESQRAHMPVLNKMLTNGSGISAPSPSSDFADIEMEVPQQSAHAATPRAVLVTEPSIREDRRTGLPDHRENPVERRTIN
jgi:curved DNA-binding protein